VDLCRAARDVREVTPDWYVVRDGDGGATTFISCDSWEYMPDGLLMESGKLVRFSEDRIAMCRHSMLDVDEGVAVEMSYARVLLGAGGDWSQPLAS